MSIDEERDGAGWHNSMFLESRTHVHKGVHFWKIRSLGFQSGNSWFRERVCREREVIGPRAMLENEIIEIMVGWWTVHVNHTLAECQEVNTVFNFCEALMIEKKFDACEHQDRVRHTTGWDWWKVETLDVSSLQETWTPHVPKV